MWNTFLLRRILTGHPRILRSREVISSLCLIGRNSASFAPCRNLWRCVRFPCLQGSKKAGFWLRTFASGRPHKPTDLPPPDRTTKFLVLTFSLFSFVLFNYSLSLVLVRLPIPVSYTTFLKLLERGEVSDITVDILEPVASVKLSSPNPGTVQRLLKVYFHELRGDFEQSIRVHENAWGIPENDRVPICYGDALADALPDISSVLCVFVTGFMTIASFRRLLSYTVLRRRNLLTSGKRNGKGTATKSEQEAQDAARKRKATEQNDSDRYYGGLPFSLDPFGFQTVKPVTTNVKFKDVAGLHASKEEVMEFVSYLKDPKKYQALGAKLPKGALLLGPPGTGKTLLVKALANEADVPFFSMAGSEFVEVIGGLGASRIRRLFRTARTKAPAIIFIDELDSLGRRRSAVDSGGRRGGSQGGMGPGIAEMEQTLNQLLVEMDGMDTEEGVIVFAATNRADLLDKALLRAGRFDRHIFIDLPNLAERKELLEMYIAKYRISTEINQVELINRLASWTPGMSGADIARLCNEAALVAARRDDVTPGVTRNDFEVAFERILAGAAKKSNPLSPPERRVAAVQEAGRALVAWLLPRTGLVPIKISIVPRTMAGEESSGGLGFTHLVPEERRLFNTEELKDRMAVLLGGRAAEQRYLKAASDLAFRQIREWGLSKTIGHLSFENDPSGSEYTMKPYSQRTQAMIELEAQQMVSASFTRCVDLLQANKDKLHRLIASLLQKEVLEYDELVKICQDTSSDSTHSPDDAKH
ncbi:ATP-dependent metallopeptidase HflB [Opisthorchis viverrini]|uniref:ATP-dependent metallopeptidase HflB n=1 Tax=Opisthorchis viverrini TaxID=6198 RepID=A0A1S8X0M4_OPIVI|nr:ATP-dependent metallopeptidase HflB [Opisthorchis viverrini]